MKKNYYIALVLGASLQLLPVSTWCSDNRTLFTEQEMKNAVEVLSSSYSFPKEQTVTNFIEDESLELVSQISQQSGSSIKSRIGLSIDGGGIRGYMPAIWLNELKIAYEEDGEIETSYPLSTIFDYVGGTGLLPKK